MTRKVAATTLAEPVAVAMAGMTSGRYRHLPVLNDGRLVDMVSIGDW